jgi:dTDP-4-amino-4,6-dideoxygalactose transaminase
VEDFSNSNWHMFQIVLPAQVERGAFIAQMHAAGIGVGVHYPAIHLLTLYRQMGFKAGDFPQAEHIGRGIATLPLFPAMRDQDVERVCEQTARTLRALSGRPRPAGTPDSASAAIVSGR